MKCSVCAATGGVVGLIGIGIFLGGNDSSVEDRLTAAAIGRS